VKKGRASGRWIQEALGTRPRRLGKGRHHKKAVRLEPAKKGALHRMLRIPMGRKIPLHVLRRAAKAPGLLGRRARFALNVRGLGKRK
jgi:hypothetical protein